MGVFANAKKARASGGPRLYHDEGDFKETIVKVESTTTTKPPVRDVFAVETRILEVERTEEMVNKGVRKGSIVNWATLSDKEAFLGNVKAFVLALLSIDDEDAFDEKVSDINFEALLLALAGKHQLAAGMRIDVSARLSPSENVPDFIGLKWQGVPFEEQTEEGQEALKQIMKVLGGTYEEVLDEDGERVDKKTIAGIQKKIDEVLAA
jgi:hypothetical protein